MSVFAFITELPAFLVVGIFILFLIYSAILFKHPFEIIKLLFRVKLILFATTIKNLLPIFT